MSRIEDINIERLEAELKTTKRMFSGLYNNRLIEVSIAAMSGFCANNEMYATTDDQKFKEIYAQMAVEQAKSLLDALEKEGKGEDE